jgi:hypothetical protein
MVLKAKGKILVLLLDHNNYSSYILHLANEG